VRPSALDLRSNLIQINEDVPQQLAEFLGLFRGHVLDRVIFQTNVC
jgi:hypothetical protein